MNTTGTTFNVSPVTRATDPLPEIPYLQAIDSLLSEPFRREKQRLQEHLALSERYPDTEGDEAGAWTKHLMHRQALLEAEEASATRPFETCSRYHGRLVAGVLAHPVLFALHRAFTQHRPLCLSPDMIWLLLCQGVANHVNVHAERLRPRFVRHPGKARI